MGGLHGAPDKAPIPYRNNVIISKWVEKRWKSQAPIPYRNNVIIYLTGDKKLW